MDNPIQQSGFERIRTTIFAQKSGQTSASTSASSTSATSGRVADQWLASPSLIQRMRDVRFRSSGFDYLRIVLSSSIIIWHTAEVCYGSDIQLTFNPVIRAIELAFLPMFFSLSGFLVAGSLERAPNIKTFLGLRVLRIAPALSVEVLLSAIIIGVLFTNLPLNLYFTNKEFFVYFLNIVGDVHFSLPGVFKNNPIANLVNVQIWTIPYELKCYIMLVIVSAIGLIKNRWLLLAALLITQAVFAIHGFSGIDVYKRITVGGSVLVLSFLFGVLIYTYKDYLKFSHSFGLLSGVALFICLLFGPTRFLCAFPAAYFTIYIGLLNPPRAKHLLSGDYSYGLYLYGFPIQQAVAALGPNFQHWYTNLALAFPLAALFATGSWWLVEKNCLQLRKHLN